jgi:alkylhydroperoxidase family enzyme
MAESCPDCKARNTHTKLCEANVAPQSTAEVLGDMYDALERFAEESGALASKDAQDRLRAACAAIADLAKHHGSADVHRAVRALQEDLGL